ncbi:hypothetical protein TNIN_376111 [Trichonephila inaurata madagascariensis]|uniref:Uncharacterized protein n=1 Tax=Trichonephila inaurata madagascariensis TaxID=2747483 RepID=A0A8X7CCT7_9ARAC|nr:hypothetical protein TNIN_376111 [Trichonephila inaurata madagascariensis]
MHLAYGAADESGRRSWKVYEKRYPDRRIPQHQMFARMHCNLRSNMYDAGRRQLTRFVNVEERVLLSFEEYRIPAHKILLRSQGSVSQQCGG